MAACGKGIGGIFYTRKGKFLWQGQGGPLFLSCLADGPQVQTLLILDGRPRPLKWRGAPPKNWYVHEPSHELQIRNLQRSLNSECSQSHSSTSALMRSRSPLLWWTHDQHHHAHLPSYLLVRYQAPS